MPSMRKHMLFRCPGFKRTVSRCELLRKTVRTAGMTSWPYTDSPRPLATRDRRNRHFHNADTTVAKQKSAQ